MKVKKVEIQAFRAYKEKCIFDFQTFAGKCADFVSIYAPNGFGKTSFYDAVEWAMTNNIDRFARNEVQNKAFAQYEKQLNFEYVQNNNPQYILKNKNARSDAKSFVRIQLNDNQEKYRSLPDVIRKNGADYHFDNEKTENIYFRNVILSQENIDAFLKEDQPDLRYKKFMNFFGDKELDTYHHNLLLLIRANNNKIAEHERNIKRLQAELPLNTDNEILDKLNTAIELLAEKGEYLIKVNPSFTEQDFLLFANQVSDKLISVKSRHSNNENSYNKIKSIDSELQYYFNALNQEKIYEFSLADFKKAKRVYIDIFKINNELKLKQEIIKAAITEKIELEDIINSVDIYNYVSKYIKDQQTELNKLRSESVIQTENFRKYKHDVDLKKTQIESLRKSINNIILQIVDIDAIDEQLVSIKAALDEINLLEKSINTENEKISKQLDEYVLLENAVEFEISQVINSQFPNSIKNSENYSSIFFEIQNKIDKQNTLIKELNDTEVDIKNSNILKSELQSLLQTAETIVTKNKDSSCPVCNHEFDSFEELIKSIHSNSLISDSLRKLSDRKNEILGAINGVTKDITRLKDEILVSRQQYLKTVKDNIMVLESHKVRNNSVSVSNKHKLTELLKKYTNFQSRLEGYTAIDYKEILNNRLAKYQKDIADLTEDYNNNVKDLEAYEIFVERNKILMSDIEYDIKAQELSKEYLKVSSYLVRYNIGNDNLLETLTSFSENKQQIVQESVYEEAILKDSLEEKMNAVAQLTESFIDNEIISLNSLIEKVRIETLDYKIFLKEYIHENAFDYSYLQIKGIIENILLQFKSKIESDILLLDDLSKLIEYKDNALPFLKFRSITETIDSLSKAVIDLKEKIGTELIIEKEKVISFINQQIESFFYEELINKIYEKIDPHPDYKKITFKCDFSNDKPKLNVFVNGDGTEHLIPNLYFSTAQMNILSLSIFLANALNAKDDKGSPIDCIFIDDPIQAMDSINVLSTIDLFRSIVFNFKKQIILSTHDENFHKLLERKIPPALFSSKFIELESFGKVKMGE